MSKPPPGTPDVPPPPSAGAGWHADPFGRHEHRYHDGTGWTANVSDNGVQGHDVPQAGPSARAPAPPVVVLEKKRKTGIGTWLVLGVIVLFVVAAAASSSGGGGSDPSAGADTSAAEAAVQSATPAERGVAQATTPAATPAAAATWKVKRISGDGDEVLGTLHVPTDGVLRWQQRDAENFILSNSYDDDHSLATNSIASSGKTLVLAGTYHEVEVIGGSNWSFTLAPK